MNALLFDFGGTLDADGTTWLDRFYPLYKEEGVDVAREAFDRAFYASDDALPVRYDLRSLSLEETLNLQVGGVLEILAPLRRAGAEAIVRRFLEGSRRHFRRNAPVLERLGRRYRLGLVSNFYGNLESVLKSEGLLGYFGAVADSGVVGALKPSAAIFEHALRGLKTTSDEAVMVGDSIPRDMRGAEGLRMRHAWISPDPAEDRACCRQSLRLSSLPELEALLS